MPGRRDGVGNRTNRVLNLFRACALDIGILANDNGVRFARIRRIRRDDRMTLFRGNYDLLTCYSGIEHFPDVQKFLDNACSSLRPGGALIAQFPSPLAPFAILNRILPQSMKKKLLNTLLHSKADELGYPVSYDKCRYTAFKAAAERSGLQVEYYLPSFMSSGYFTWLLPLFLLSQLLDVIRLVIGSKDMASYNLFVLRRPGAHFPIKWSWHCNS